MPETSKFVAFGLVALGMVITPGPNMAYLISRSISQGRIAGFISLAGVALGFVFYMLCAALGITALLFAVPFAYESLRWIGAAYLLYLAWQAIKPGGHSPFVVKELQKDSSQKLFAMGFLTNILNPKAAALYLSLLPQFTDPQLGNVLAQNIAFGMEQILISLTVNAIIIVTAGSAAVFLTKHPRWVSVQRWTTGTIFATLAGRMAIASRR